MQGDRRQIQTAVLGGADSEEPLMLPLEAIELDAFRRRHQHDTFWCGLLLGGCGAQLTTKLYTDRVCHFAHHPGPDGHPHICGRRSRGVSSADHLYVKSAAAAWLRERDEQAEIGFGQPDGAPIGSVVDIASQGRRLRVHLDQMMEPVWDDDGVEPVLGVSVPIERDTLIRRWYVHRIRLDSEGTARRISIGTEAFARPTEWFALDECEIGERGLSTPAVERIVRSRRTAPPSRWSAGRARKAPEPDARAQVLLRRLADARRVDSVVVVTRVCREIAALAGASPDVQHQRHAAVRDAQVWLEKQAEVRRDLFARLDEAVSAQKAASARELLVRVNATAAHERTEAEDQIVGAAADFLSAQGRGQRALDAKREAEEAAEMMAAAAALAASHAVSRILSDLRRRACSPHVGGDAAQSGAGARRSGGRGRQTHHPIPDAADRPVEEPCGHRTSPRLSTDCGDPGHAHGIVKEASDHDRGMGVEEPLRRPARGFHPDPPGSIRPARAAAL